MYFTRRTGDKKERAVESGVHGVIRQRGGDGGFPEQRPVDDGHVVLGMEFLVVGVDFVVLHLTRRTVDCGPCCAAQVREMQLCHLL